MIRGIHGLFYSSDPEATRAFFRDLVKLPGTDIGDGWWIFDFSEGDLGVHPVDEPSAAGGHDISFYCDDIQGTVRDLKSRGVPFTKDVEDHGYGLVTYFTAPGGITVQLYEPRYQKPAAKKARAAAKRTAKRAKTSAKKAGGAKSSAKKAGSKKAGSKKARSKKAGTKKAGTKKAARKATNKKKAR